MQAKDAGKGLFWHFLKVKQIDQMKKRGIAWIGAIQKRDSKKIAWIAAIQGFKKKTCKKFFETLRMAVRPYEEGRQV